MGLTSEINAVMNLTLAFKAAGKAAGNLPSATTLNGLNTAASGITSGGSAPPPPPFAGGTVDGSNRISKDYIQSYIQAYAAALAAGGNAGDLLAIENYYNYLGGNRMFGPIQSAAQRLYPQGAAPGGGSGPSGATPASPQPGGAGGGGGTTGVTFDSSNRLTKDYVLSYVKAYADAKEAGAPAGDLLAIENYYNYLGGQRMFGGGIDSIAQKYYPGRYDRAPGTPAGANLSTPTTSAPGTVGGGHGGASGAIGSLGSEIAALQALIGKLTALPVATNVSMPMGKTTSQPTGFAGAPPGSLGGGMSLGTAFWQGSIP